MQGQGRGRLELERGKLEQERCRWPVGDVQRVEGRRKQVEQGRRKLVGRGRRSLLFERVAQLRG